MAQIITFFHTHQMSKDHYDQVTGGLGLDEGKGAQGPKGRLFHACYGHPEKMTVIDVWESREAFDEFSKALGPTLEKAGIILDRIEIVDAHNVRVQG